MRRVLALIPAVAACLAVAQPVAAGTIGGGHGTVGCRQYGTVRAGAYKVRDDFWHGRVCVTASSAGFTVTRTRFPAATNPTYAFPNIFTGCEWGICTPSSGLPARVSALRKPQVTLQTSGNPAGGWSAAIETWFSARPMRTGQADQAELMVWLRARWRHDSYKVVKIAGVRYFVAHWIHHGGGTWNYIQFRLVRPAGSVTGLKLAPFISYAIRHGWIKAGSWMDNIEGGFELRAGGEGLAVRRFSARP